MTPFTPNSNGLCLYSSPAVVIADLLLQLGTVVPSIIAVIGGLVGVVVGNRLALSAQLRQQAAAHAQARRDARQDRVREAYVAVLRAALVFNQVAAEKSVVRVGETIETRDQRHTAAMMNLADTLTNADLVLRLEGNNPDVLALYFEVQQAYTSYIVGRELNAEQPGSIDLPELEKAQRIMLEKLNALVLKMWAQLESDVAPAPPAVPRSRRRVWRKGL